MAESRCLPVVYVKISFAALPFSHLRNKEESTVRSGALFGILGCSFVPVILRFEVCELVIFLMIAIMFGLVWRVPVGKYGVTLY